MVKLLLLLIILILVNAFLAASEVSVVSLNKNRLRELAEDGDRKAQRLLKFAEEPNIFLSTIQVGITLAGFLASAAAADGFAGGLMAWLYERLGTSGISLSVCHVLAVVLVRANTYRGKNVMGTKELCEQKGIGYLRFFVEMPNEPAYIIERTGQHLA